LANVLLEAMAAGLVVIATDVDGTGEVIINNKTGLLFRPGDIEKATGLLNSMINAPASMRQMGNVAMNYIKENNSTEKIVEQYKKLFT
jgi:glycosyltransferase involved in cell wall biosynthesis